MAGITTANRGRHDLNRDIVMRKGRQRWDNLKIPPAFGILH